MRTLVDDRRRSRARGLAAVLARIQGVLVVDDAPYVRDVLSEYLRDMERAVAAAIAASGTRQEIA